MSPILLYPLPSPVIPLSCASHPDNPDNKYFRVDNYRLNYPRSRDYRKWESNTSRKIHLLTSDALSNSPAE